MGFSGVGAGFGISACLAPDGKTITAACEPYGPNGYITLWDTVTRKELQAYEYGVSTVKVAFSPDGKVVATADFLGDKITLMDLATGKQLKTLRPENGATSMGFSPDSKLLVCIDSFGKGRLYDLETEKERNTFQASSRGGDWLVFSRDGGILATGGGIGDKPFDVKLWDVVTGKELTAFKGNSEGVRCVAFSPDGKILASGGNDKTVKLWDISAFSQPP
jgi:WD40 repeat protein